MTRGPDSEATERWVILEDAIPCFPSEDLFSQAVISPAAMKMIRPR